MQTTDGPKPVKNVVLQRTYKDKDGNFQHAASFSAADIPKAQLVLQKAFEYLVLEQGSQ